MALKPIFVATHPRSCSTAFERVFMTQTDTLKCVHEPFGDAFYYGPERLSERYEADEEARVASGFSEATYQSVLKGIESQKEEGKRVFIKDMAQYLCPPDGAAEVALSLAKKKRGVGTDLPLNVVNGMDSSAGAANGKPVRKPRPDANGAGAHRNPTVLPEEVLQQFDWVFLIRNPLASLPSYYRCTIPPLVELTGFHHFMPSEAGYRELRLIFDHLRATAAVGPGIAGHAPTPPAAAEWTRREICIIDADDLLDDPSGVVRAFCKTVGLPYDPNMLKWDSPAAQAQARAAFAKWQGFHEDALDTTELAPRTHRKKTKSVEQHHHDWVEKFGQEAADMLYQTVERNMKDYEYLKKFAMKV